MKRENWGDRGAPEVVRTEELGPVLRRWCENWDALHEDRQKPFSLKERETPYLPPANHVTQLAGKPWLALHADVSERTIYAIVNEEMLYVRLAIADALLSAMGKNEMLATGEITVLANPRWTMEDWIAYMAEMGCA